MKDLEGGNLGTFPDTFRQSPGITEYVMLCIAVGSWRLTSPDALQPKAYCTNPGLIRSYLHRQVSPPETLVVKGGTTWARNGR